VASRQRHEWIVGVLHGEEEVAHVEHEAPEEDDGEEEEEGAG
jgi:hypothetical protein